MRKSQALSGGKEVQCGLSSHREGGSLAPRGYDGEEFGLEKKVFNLGNFQETKYKNN